jgi:hypothetical protein
VSLSICFGRRRINSSIALPISSNNLSRGIPPAHLESLFAVSISLSLSICFGRQLSAFREYIRPRAFTFSDQDDATDICVARPRSLPK